MQSIDTSDIVDNPPVTCALPGCTNPVPQNPNAPHQKKYCSNAHKQKAYRQRKFASLKRNKKNVTISRFENIIPLLPDLPIDQLKSLQELITQEISARNTKTENEPFLYFRKGSNVIHLAVSHNVTICGRETASMQEINPGKTERICSHCAKVRERGTWWKTWRKDFGST